ncbi:MAG: FapA family protein [Treponema sp.]|nr:FapA family protein [Treponema sp.]
MVTLEKIRIDMQDLLDRESALHDVEVNADTIDEALADAAVQLNTRAINLEYEVLEKGSSGFLGLGKKPWKLKIYQNPSTIVLKKSASGQNDVEGDGGFETVRIEDKDGFFYVRHFGSDILLKVTLPIGKGEAVDVKDVLAKLKRPDTTSVEEDLVRKYVKQGTNNDYQVVGTYKHIASADAMLVIDISKDEMHATVTASPPAMSGADISVSMIERALKSQGVSFGISEEKIQAFVDSPVYDSPFEVASGTPPQDGKDAYIAYDFETDTSKLRAKVTESGQVDFKELNLIQNVIKGGRLAQKIPAERGKPGKTLSGRYIEAKNGKDIPIPLGQNTSLANDGVTVIANVDGQVMISAGKITVEPLLQLSGVNIKTGNVKFLGTVIVKGNVEDGFNVEASGFIEVSGTVGNSKVSAGGDIIVQQGIFGKDEGMLVSKKSLWAKFIQSAKVEVDGSVIVSDSIMNSEITAMKTILLSGKKAQITGGHLFATEEIAAKNIGSPGGGAETILEVGFDPRSKQRIDELQARQADLLKEAENLELDISTSENQKKARRTIPKEKEETLVKLQERKSEVDAELESMAEEIQTLQAHLRDLKVIGKVKAAGTVYSGVKIYVRDLLDEVRTDVKSVTFYAENGFIRRGKYEAPTTVKGPDGYSTN